MKTFTVYGTKDKDKPADQVVFQNMIYSQAALARSEATARMNGYKRLEYHENPCFENGYKGGKALVVNL